MYGLPRVHWILGNLCVYYKYCIQKQEEETQHKREDGRGQIDILAFSCSWDKWFLLLGQSLVPGATDITAQSK